MDTYEWCSGVFSSVRQGMTCTLCGWLSDEETTIMAREDKTFSHLIVTKEKDIEPAFV